VRARAEGLRALLNDWDFIGVFDPEANTDEYVCMIEPLLRKLISGARLPIVMTVVRSSSLGSDPSRT
jgi:hypothetical protein